MILIVFCSLSASLSFAQTDKAIDEFNEIFSEAEIFFTSIDTKIYKETRSKYVGFPQNEKRYNDFLKIKNEEMKNIKSFHHYLNVMMGDIYWQNLKQKTRRHLVDVFLNKIIQKDKSKSAYQKYISWLILQKLFHKSFKESFSLILIGQKKIIEKARLLSNNAFFKELINKVESKRDIKKLNFLLSFIVFSSLEESRNKEYLNFPSIYNSIIDNILKDEIMSTINEKIEYKNMILEYALKNELSNIFKFLEMPKPLPNYNFENIEIFIFYQKFINNFGKKTYLLDQAKLILSADFDKGYLKFLSSKSLSFKNNILNNMNYKIIQQILVANNTEIKKLKIKINAVKKIFRLTNNKENFYEYFKKYLTKSDLKNTYLSKQIIEIFMPNMSIPIKESFNDFFSKSNQCTNSVSQVILSLFIF